MNKIAINNVSRIYKINKNDSFYALRNITLTFENRGFISIIGKSGSGKSTLLNLIAGLDSPTSGDIYFSNKNIKKIKKTKFYKKDISVLFQNCNLIEDKDAYFNISLPLYINGEKETKIKKRTLELFSLVNLKEETLYKNANLLSGGEKQRVALARALINNSDVLLCDEPTGALDSKNSKMVMDILKDYSKNHLVVMVSHNLQLVNEYSDRVIELSQGRIINKYDKNKIKDNDYINKRKISQGKKWINILSIKNIKKRFFRNLFSFFALGIALTSCLLSFGFINGKDNSINNLSQKQFDFGVANIQKEEKISKESVFSLLRSTRPDISKLKNNVFVRENFVIYPCYDALIPSNIKIKYGDFDFENLLYSPIESFINSSIDTSLISRGYLPNKDTLNEVVINNSAYEYILEKTKTDPLNQLFTCSYQTKTRYVDVNELVVEDYFSYQINFTVVGIIKEMNYLQNPKIYYSYLSLDNYMSKTKVNNLSTYKNQNISWKERIEEAENFDSITGYSYRLFLKDIKDASILYSDYELNDNLVINSSSLLVRSSLINFMDVAKYGLTAFLIVALIGTICVMSIMAFASYSEDHKISAILSCLGASNSEIYEIYLNESFTTGFISLLISFVVSYFLSLGINQLIYGVVELENLINIPIFSFLNIPYLFPLLILLITTVLCFISTIVPILFSKRISLKEELQSL